MGSYVKFLASKSRATPVKEETISRLELLAALIAARLIRQVCEALEPEVDVNEMTCWTDSKVALTWIKDKEREWKPFVQNRVNEIRTLVPVKHWRHCHRKINPTDIPSRGMRSLELSECASWIEGPTWLTEDDESENDEFNNKQHPHECLEWRLETRRIARLRPLSSLLVTAEATGIAKIMKCEDYSELLRLLRVIGLVLKLVKILK